MPPINHPSCGFLSGNPGPVHSQHLGAFPTHRTSRLLVGERMSLGVSTSLVSLCMKTQTRLAVYSRHSSTIAMEPTLTCQKIRKYKSARAFQPPTDTTVFGACFV